MHASRFRSTFLNLFGGIIAHIFHAFSAYGKIDKYFSIYCNIITLFDRKAFK